MLAAGAGTRYGQPKAFVRFEGELLVARAARELIAAGCAPVIVVLGAGREAQPKWQPPPEVEMVANPQWEEGIGSSLRCGLSAVEGSGADAVLLTLVDLPWVGAPAHRRVVAAWQPGDLAVVASYGGEPGHPVLFPATAFKALARQAAGDVGARGWLRANSARVRQVDCSDVATASDVDHPGDLLARDPARLRSP